MNPDQPLEPREELEVRLTAHLLGELTPDEAATLEKQMGGDAELAALHGRLRVAVDLLREASNLKEQPAPPTPLKLAPDRREHLLEHFKARPQDVAPKVEPPRRQWKWMLSYAAAAAVIVFILASVALPQFAGISPATARRLKLDRLPASGVVTGSQILAEESNGRALHRRWDVSSDKPGSVAAIEDGIALAAPKVGYRTGAVPSAAPAGELATLASPPSAASPPVSAESMFDTLGAVSGPATRPTLPALPGAPPTSTMTAQVAPGKDASVVTGGMGFGNGAIADGDMDGKSLFPPQIPQDFGGRTTADAGATGAIAAFPITPTTPAEPEQDPRIAGEGRSGRETLAGFAAPQISRSNIVNESAPPAPSKPAGLAGVSESARNRSDDMVDVTADFDVGVGQAPPVVSAAESKDKAHYFADVNAPQGQPTHFFELQSQASQQQGGTQVRKFGSVQAGGGIAAGGEPQSRAWAAWSDEFGKPAGGFNANWGRVTDLALIPDGTNESGGTKHAPGSTAGDAVELAKELAERGEFDAAKSEISKGLGVTAESKSLITRLDDADRYKAVRDLAAPAEGNADVEKQLQRAQGQLQLGDLDEARKSFTKALAADPSNVTARYGLEKLGEKIQGLSESGDQTREKSVDELSHRAAETKSESETKPVDAPVQPGADAAPANRPAALPELKEATKSEGEIEEMVKQDAPVEKPAAPPPVPQPEVETRANPFSTFSLNVTDVSFKLAAANLEQSRMPDPATVRSEEFINAFDYRDPEPKAGAPLAFAFERARYPFAQNRDLVRLSVKTAAAGRQPGRALNLVVLLDNSGSMERSDRVQIVREALRVLSAQLQATDKLSVITFARTPTLWADGVAGDKAAEATSRVGEITPQGGTNIESALQLGYQTALRHYQVGNVNRVVLLTDGAANLGDVNPDALKQKVESHRRQGIALDCFGVGWEGYDDTLLEALSRNGDGRYGFINSIEEAATEFAGQLAGALQVAASDVKVQVEFNPHRVTAYRQVGYAKHQLTKEQFRDNTVDAAEIGAAESGNALYIVEVNPRGEGDLATVRVRFKVPGTADYREHEWSVPFTGEVPPLEHASPTLRLAGVSAAFSEWLVSSLFAAEVTSDRLLAMLGGVPAFYGADSRPQKLEWMIRQAANLSGR